MGRPGYSLKIDALRAAWPLLGLLAGLPPPASLRCAQWILLWGVSLVAPLALRLVGQRSWLLDLTAPLMLLGYLWEGNWLVAASALWLACTLQMAWEVREGEWTTRLAFYYAPVGGIWAVASAWKHGLMGFDPLMTLLTANHFLYVTLGAMVWAGQAAPRSYPARLMWITPAFVAAGITLTHWLGHPTWLEGGAVTLQVIATVGVSLIWLWRGDGLVLKVSALCSLLTMVLALNYAWGRLLGMPHLDLAWMIPYHGLVNALGFVTLGLLGWNYRAA
ncbi:YndJ family transporter [bacterium]|nr:YndJ family transporter [bacterium]